MAMARTPLLLRSDPPALERLIERDWGPVKAALVRAAPGPHAPPPSADHRLLFYTAGEVNSDCRSADLHGSRRQAPGEFDLVPAEASGAWCDDGPAEMVSLLLSPRLVVETAGALGPPANDDLAPALGMRDPQVEHILLAVLAELRSPAPAGRLFIDALSTALVIRLIRLFGAPVQAAPGQTLANRQMRRIAEYVSAHLDRDLSLGEIAAVAGLSVSHLTPLFRRTCGRSVHRYVLERRIEHARRLLLESSAPIAEIALQTGFAHQSHLARWMRTLIGATPAQLRREHRGAIVVPAGIDRGAP
jgi:AraC family transcriptional regulator